MYKTTYNNKEPSTLKKEIPLSAGTKKSRQYSALTRLDFNEQIIDQWAEIKISKKPPRRSEHISFIYNEYYYIYGGRDLNQDKMADLFRVNINFVHNDFHNLKNKFEWEKLNYSGNFPGKISCHKGCIVENKLYVYGGLLSNDILNNNLYILNLSNLIWDKKEFNKEQVMPLYDHTMTTLNNKIVIFGGCNDSSFSNILYIYDIKKNIWCQYPNEDLKTINYEKDENALPEKRKEHSQISYNNKIYIYGGVAKNDIYLNDLWSFDFGLMKWTEIKLKGEEPRGRKGHSAILYNNSMFIFGGKVGNLMEINQLLKFDLIKERFTLIHDTMLERALNDEASRIISAISSCSRQSNQNNNNNKRNNNNISNKKKLKEIWRPFLDDENAKKGINKKKQNLNEIYKMNKTVGNQRSFSYPNKKENPYEDMALIEPNVKTMKFSLIYKMGNEEEDVDDNLFYNEIKNINKYEKIENIKSGIVPAPRDGHTCEIFNDNMYIFGGDRNKFPYNDMFMFSFNK